MKSLFCAAPCGGAMTANMRAKILSWRSVQQVVVAAWVLSCMGSQPGGASPLISLKDPPSNTYEPIHNATDKPPKVNLSDLPTYGKLTPGEVAVIKVTGDPSIVVKNDIGFDITDLHWLIPASADIRGQKVVGEAPVPKDWNQPDVHFQAQTGNQAGKSDIFKTITPTGKGPFTQLTFKDGVIKNGSNFTDSKDPSGGGSIVTHYAQVWYSVSSAATGQSGTGKSEKSLSYDASTSRLSITPFALSAAYITSEFDLLNENQVDPEFSSDPILGATISATPFTYAYTYNNDDGVDKAYFTNSSGTLTITKGDVTFLTASLDSGMVFDPTQRVPFFAPLTNVSLNLGLGSNFLADMEARLFDSNAPSFDLALAPDSDFFQATQDFTVSADIGSGAGIVQNGHPVPEPSSLALLVVGLFLAAARLKWGSVPVC
jgi:hypothetical protein